MTVCGIVVDELIEGLFLVFEEHSGFCELCLIIVLSGSLMLRPVGFLSASLEDKVGASFVAVADLFSS